ncbi:MAG: tetratricopeptide repeat protein [Candidatus Krumholzibacteriota bacterium]|nr:tetratricopeptide repeat protein [Candidatus Krumholzibacteriota bacterium]
MSVLRRLAVLAALLALAAGAAALEDEEELLFFRKLVDDGLNEVAAGQMEAFLDIKPDHPEAAEVHYLLGRCYLALADAERAMAHAAAFAAGRPEDPRVCAALYDAAAAGAEAGLLARAAPLLETLLRDHSDCPERQRAVLLSARIQAGRGEEAAALQLLSVLVEQGGSEELVGRALWERAQLKRAERPEDARADLEAIKASTPGHPLAGFAALELATLDENAGRADAAARELAWVIDRFAGTELAARALLRRADLHEAAGRPGEAVRDLRALRRGFPGRGDDAQLQEREVVLLVAAGEGREAWRRAGELAAAREGDARAARLLGRAAAAAGRRDDAVAAWRRAADLDPAGGEGLGALRELFDLLAGEDDAAELPATAARLLARLAGPDERARVLLALGDRHARAGRDAAARRAWEAVESDCAGATLLPEALFRLAALEEEAGRWDAAEALYTRLQREHGASARGIEAVARREALDRYYRVDEGAAVEALLAVLDAERRQGAARGREFRVGLVLLEQLKDFPRAADYFRELAGELGEGGDAVWAHLLAGRAAARQAERLELAGGTRERDAWRARARADLEACLAGATGRVAGEAELELTLLMLAPLPEGPDRLPLLDRFLAAHPDAPGAARLFYERGEIHRTVTWSDPDAGRARALADYEAALARDPGGAWGRKARLAAGRLALEAGRHDEAQDHFRRLVREAPGTYEGAEARFGLGELAEARQRFRQALDEFQSYLDLAPTSPRRARCLVHMGDCHYFLQEWDAAAAAYARVLEESTDDPLADDAAFRWALTEERRGDAAAARERLRWLLANGSPRLRQEAAWRLGRDAAEAGDRAAAIEHLGRLLALGWEGEHTAAGGMLLGELLLEDGRGEAALAAYDSLLARVDLGDARPRAGAGRVRALLLAGRHEAAWAAWQEISEAPGLTAAERAGVLLAFGRARAGAGDAAGARRFFDECLARHAETGAAAWALYERALLAARGGDWDAALADFDALLARRPDHPAAAAGAVKAAGILYGRGDYEGASARYEAAVARQAEPGPDLLYHSALALEKRGRPAEALARVQALLARHPEDARVPEAMMKVGYYLQEMGQYDRAILAYRNAELFQDREGRARLHYWLADCLAAKGDRAEALAAFLRVSYLFADEGMWGVTATLRAAELYAAGGEVEQARRLYEKVEREQGAASEFGRAAAEARRRLEDAER